MQWMASVLAIFGIVLPLISCIEYPSSAPQFGGSSSYYTIVTAKSIRPYSDYRASITGHNNVEPLTVQLSIEAETINNSNDSNYKTERTITIAPNQTEVVTLSINDLDVTKKYKLVAEGLSGIVFKEEYNLNVELKNVSIFVQTDKAIYKPGETIKFRILVLDSELRPVQLVPEKPLSIYLTDPENNRVKQWLKAKPKKGVFTSEFQLSELPILGDWKFEANVGDETKTKDVQVAEYVLPKFDLKIDAPNDISIKDGKLRAIIQAKYTYGKMVKGKAIVSLCLEAARSFYASDSLSKVIKTVPIDGKGTVEFNFETDLTEPIMQFHVTRVFNLTVTFVEELTGRNQTESKRINFHESRFKIETSELKRGFNPGKPVKFQVTVRYHDNSLILLNNQTQQITIKKSLTHYTHNHVIISPRPVGGGYPYRGWTTGLSSRRAYPTGRYPSSPRKVSLAPAISEPSFSSNDEVFNFELNADGVANVEIPTQANNADFQLRVNYMHEETSLGRFYRNTDSIQTEFDIKVITKRPTLYENVEIEVQTTDPIESFTYLVAANSKLIFAEKISAPNSPSHLLKFNTTFELFPKATVIVYYIKRKKLVSKSVDVAIDEDLKNFVELKVSQTEVQPGKSVNVSILTTPESHVGLVGVDQSVLLLKKNDGLSKDDIISELNKYHEQQSQNMRPVYPGFFHYSHGFSKEFMRSNLLLLTNFKDEPTRPAWNRPPMHHPYPSHRTIGWSSISTYSSAPSSAQSSSAYPHHQFIYPSSTPAPIAPITIEPPRLRTDFPETWLWEDFDINEPDGMLTITKKVPDTITSWVISALSVNPTLGLGLTKTPKTVRVFQSFFVSLNLPYSVKRGEVVAVPVTLFNYLDANVSADITLHNENGDFEFVDGDNDVDKTMRKRQVTVASDSGVSARFLVRFTAVGSIPLKVTATSAVAGDSIERILQVDPEGVPQFINKAVFVDLREANEFDTIQSVDVPANAVDGSLKINVNAIGDLLGGTIQNLHQLIRLPTGCGEQNMLNFVPNIVVLDYLNAAGDIDGAIKDKAIKYMETGYQRELTYRHDDGSFSAFGKSDNEGSSWLTAFVAQSFKQAEHYIDIDDKIIDRALEFLNSTQANDGSFSEPGRVVHEAMQGGSSKGIALTAYITIAFLMNKKSDDWKYQETVNKAIENIVSSVNEIKGPYAHAIAAYALQLADHSKKDEMLDSLVAKTISSGSGNLRWWTKSNDASAPEKSESKSINVEITSYGMLALLEANRVTAVLPYFKWLLAQRNEQGGFIGTQDTVMGLKALAAYARLISTKDTAIQLKIQAATIEEHLLNVKTENALVLQTIEMPSDTKSVHLNATGQGFALFQLSYRYNLNESLVNAFTLTTKVLDTTAGHLTVEVCSRFNPKTPDEKHSNMVVLEVSMPSGLLVDNDRLVDLLHKPHVKLAKLKNGETIADIYIDQMPANETICLEFEGYRTHKVAENKPVPVRIYDYYDSSRSARNFYEIPLILPSDICEGDDCEEARTMVGLMK